MSADSAERVKQFRRQCRPLAVCICIVWMDALFFLAVAMRYGDSTGKQFEAYAQLLPRVSLEEVAMDF